MQYNLYLYCNDNPINNTDEGGNLSNWQKVAIGIGVIAVVGIVTVATAGTGTALACVAAGAFEGAVAGAASGAVIGAATGAVSSRISTGSWDGAGQAAIDGAASGFMTGAVTGAVTGGVSGSAKCITRSHCFIAGTLIVTADGYKKIEDIRTGDRVLSADEENGEISIKSVVQTFINETDELIHLQVGDEELVTTPGHPFFIYGHGFEYAGNLRAGDILVNVNGDKVVLEKVQHEILESPVKVYNFEVEDFHTYFVGEEELLVHNACGNTTKSSATNHGAKRILERGFTREKITDIVENYSHKLYQPGGRVVYAKKVGNYYDVIIMNSDGEIITAVGGNTKSLRTLKDVLKMLTNNGGYSYIH
ncbi:MAG: HINT domain-containing protein [Lachnospiraceae bacterium]|nr:HINT domain-containing protein [Lachnospiraceae bacterium]